MKRGYISLILMMLGWAAGLMSCSKQRSEAEETEDFAAKQMLQGIWLNDETDMPFMKVEGDSLFYPDAENLPSSFFIKHDTFFVIGVDTIPYQIELQTQERFRFLEFGNNLISLYHSDDEEDANFFQAAKEPLPIITERIEKDSVVMYDGKRYRGYVFVNPSKMRVIRTSIGPSGMLVDNVYYDNVIHICIYTGATLLYGKDVTKKDFADVIPANFLETSILADMDFMGVDDAGYHYQALVGDPESSASAAYLLNLTISEDKQLHISVAD
ncbi:MAG: DUF4738 domain-containing protein [Bacteroidaceae bacterium]|nr:DUF4738 domain-containing protein [Bacteroidaceae bacterium]